MKTDGRGRPDFDTLHSLEDALVAATIEELAERVPELEAMSEDALIALQERLARRFGQVIKGRTVARS